MYLRRWFNLHFNVICSCSATFYRLCQYHKVMEQNKQWTVTNVAMEAHPLVPSEGKLRQGELQYLYILLMCERRLPLCAFSLWFWREGHILRTCQPFWSRARKQGKSKKVHDFEIEDQSVPRVRTQTLSTHTRYSEIVHLHVLTYIDITLELCNRHSEMPL